MPNKPITHKVTTLYLRLAVLIFAALILGLCIFALPAGIASDNTGMYKWILLGLYIPAIPFFYAVYQAMGLLKSIDNDTVFSESSVKALNSIKFCGSLIAGLFFLGMPYIFYTAQEDDAPGVVAIALLIIGASLVFAAFAGVLQKLLQNAIDLKTENDLTV